VYFDGTARHGLFGPDEHIGAREHLHVTHGTPVPMATAATRHVPHHMDVIENMRSGRHAAGTAGAGRPPTGI
jgi:hypothetical protein